MSFPTNPFHTLQKWMEDNARRAEAARQAEAAKQALLMVGVACPSCGWVPPRGATWRCDCGHEWNTFETGGRCPGCLKIWRTTECFSCHQLLAHHQWYAGR